MRLMSNRLFFLLVFALFAPVEAAPAQVAVPVAMFAALHSDTARTKRAPTVARVAIYGSVGIAASGLVIGVMALQVMMSCGEDIDDGDDGVCDSLDHPQRVWAATSLVGAALGATWSGLDAGCTKRSVWSRAILATAVVAAPAFGTRLRDQKLWLAVAPLISLPLHANLQARCEHGP